MSEYIIDTFGIVQDLADLHGNMNTTLYQAIMDVIVSRQREEIVRCRDCVCHEHWEYNNSKPDRDICTMYYCIDVSLDDFCSSGERKQ